MDSPEARRFAQAVSMADEGVELTGQNLRRRHPGDTNREVDARLEAWLVDRPFDAPGPVVANP